MCLGLATGFCKPNQPAKRYLVTIYNEYAHITQQKTFEAKDLWDALRKAQMSYPAPQYSVVAIIQEVA